MCAAICAAVGPLPLRAIGKPHGTALPGLASNPKAMAKVGMRHRRDEFDTRLGAPSA
jgi:hypothetical protein